MRLVVLCVALGACGGSKPPPARDLWTASSARARSTDHVELDRDALARGPLRFEIDGDTYTVEHPIWRRVHNGIVVEGKFGRGGTFVVAQVGRATAGVFRVGSVGLELIPSFGGGSRIVPHRPGMPRRELHGTGWDLNAVGPAPLDRLGSREPSPKIDILFAYTKAVEDQLGADGVASFVEVAVRDLNHACEDDGTDLEFRVAGTKRTAGTEASKTLQGVYEELRNRNGAFQDAHDARAEIHADIVVLLIDKVEGGRGWGTVMGTPETAMAVTDFHNALWYLTIVHEIGHVMGALHELEDDDRDEPYPFGHAYLGTDVRTIMSTSSCTGCALIVRWSSPEHGDEDTRNNAKVLRTTGTAVSHFGDALP